MNEPLDNQTPIEEQISKPPVWKTYLPIILIALLGLALRLSTIGYGTNVDEGDYLMQGREMAEGYWPYRDVHLNKPPLVSLIAYPFFLIADAPVIPVRFFMILLSVSSIVAIYILGREIFDERAGLLAAGFWAFDSYAAIWAKPLHVSTLAPELALWATALFLLGLKYRKTKHLILSGFMASLCLLNKQTGITILPILAVIYLYFRNTNPILQTLKRFAIGFAPMPVLLLLYLTVTNTFEPFLYDTYYGNLAMADFFHDTLQDRWNAFRSIEYYNPIAWRLAPFGGLVSLIAFQGLGAIVFLWLALEMWLNVFGLSHVWTHYIMAIMPPAYLLSGFFLSWLFRIMETKFKVPALKPFWNITLVIIALLMTAPFWGRDNWAYPNITLQDEQALAAFIARNTDTEYLLNFTNTSLYFWTDTQVPPSVRGDRITRIPPFMNTAGRKYLSLDDMQKTVELWETLPMDLCVMYPKYYQQIFVDRDPHLAPVREFLQTHFDKPQLLDRAPTYYARIIYMKRKGS